MTEKDYINSLSDSDRSLIGRIKERLPQMMSAYILFKGEVIRTDVITCTFWLQDNSVRIALDWVGDRQISTVFLTVEHGIHHFETMIFSPDEDQVVVRYQTLGEAQAGHQEVLERVTRGVL